MNVDGLGRGLLIQIHKGGNWKRFLMFGFLDGILLVIKGMTFMLWLSFNNRWISPYLPIDYSPWIPLGPLLFAQSLQCLLKHLNSFPWSQIETEKLNGLDGTQHGKAVTNCRVNFWCSHLGIQNDSHSAGVLKRIYGGLMETLPSVAKHLAASALSNWTPSS